MSQDRRARMDGPSGEGSGSGSTHPPGRRGSLRAWFVRTQLRALGGRGLPPSLQVAGEEYRLERTLQHSFFAATGAYEGRSGRVVVKLGRLAAFLVVPLAWLGRWGARRERWFYERLDDLPAVPRSLGPVGETGFCHAWVEGRPHVRAESLPDAFFAELRDQVGEIHRRDMAYVDLSKAENILVGADGRPHLIDLQTAFWWPSDPGQRRGFQRLVPHRLGRRLLRQLQEADRVHVLKHWRRSSPLGLTREQYDESIRRTDSIRAHTLLRKPYRRLRGFLRRLGRRERGEG